MLSETILEDKIQTGSIFIVHFSSTSYGTYIIALADKQKRILEYIYLRDLLLSHFEIHTIFLNEFYCLGEIEFI